MGVLNKDIIETWIIPHLTVGSRGFEPTVSVEEIINAIFYRLKTGCQWREVPTKEFFSDKTLSWNSVYYHFNACGAARAVKGRVLAKNLDKHFESKFKTFGLVEYRIRWKSYAGQEWRGCRWLSGAKSIQHNKCVILV